MEALKTIKDKIISCKILPPKIQNGFLYRPLILEGNIRVKPYPKIILKKMLPFKNYDLNTELSGAIFGYLSSKASIDISNIKALNLRVFRLYTVTYSLDLENPHTPISWTLSNPQWVKLN